MKSGKEGRKSVMALSDELKVARVKVEQAMNEQSRRDDARCANAGKRYGLKERPKVADK